MLFLSLLLSLPAIGAAPNPPERLAYQGTLVDADGDVLAPSLPANYPVVFRIYDASQGGNILWAEQQIVTVDKGQFSVLLGEGTVVAGESRPDLSTVFSGPSASDRFVGITVTIGGTTMEILPRLQLMTSPYAFLARTALNAISVDPAALTTGNGGFRARGGVPGANGVNNNGYAFSGNGGDNDSGMFSTADGVLQLFTQGTERMRISPSGNVGIGTTAPGFPLNFANLHGDKISLWGNSGNSYGFGIQSSLLQIHTDGIGSDIAFGYGSSASMTERMRIKGTGSVGIGTASPFDLLHVQSSDSMRVRAQTTGSGYAGFLSKNSLTEWFAGVQIGGTYWQVYENLPANGARLVVASGGNVGIGTTAPEARLHVAGGAIRPTVGNNASSGIQFPSNPGGGGGDEGFLRYYVRSGEATTLALGCPNDADDNIALLPGGAVTIGFDGTVSGYKLYVAGAAFATGGFFPLSDERVKKDFAEVKDPLQTVMALHGVSFDWRRDEFPERNLPKSRHTGFIAQEVKEILPDVVQQDADGYYAINYDAMVPVLVEAIKEQQRGIESLKQEHAATLEQKFSRMDSLEREVAELKKLIGKLAGPDARTTGLDGGNANR